MRPVRVLTLLVPALALLSVGARAQNIPSPYRYIEPTQSLGVFAGYVFTDPGSREIGPQAGPIFGARYTIRFSGPLSGEVALGAMPSQRTVFQNVAAPGDSADLRALDEVDAFLASAEAGLRFHVTGPRSWRGLAPFVAASGGLVTDLVGTTELEEALEESERVDFGPAFAVGLGLGTDWFVTERLVLRAEVRDRLWRLTTPAGLTDTGREESEWTHNLGLTLGTALYF